MSEVLRFPQGQVLNAQGYISLEFVTVTVDNPIAITSGGTGSNTSLLAALTMAGPIYPATPTGPTTGTAQVVCAQWAGSGAPDNAGGQNGDFYFRADGTVGSNLYKKTAGLWGAIL